MCTFYVDIVYLFVCMYVCLYISIFSTVCECYLGKGDGACYKCVTVKQQPVDQQSQTLVQSSTKGVTNRLGVKEDCCAQMQVAL